MRLPQSRVSLMLELAHRRLQIGSHPVRLGTPEISLLYPCASLYAKCVVINGCATPGGFLNALVWRTGARPGRPGDNPDTPASGHKVDFPGFIVRNANMTIDSRR